MFERVYYIRVHHLYITYMYIYIKYISNVLDMGQIKCRVGVNKTRKLFFNNFTNYIIYSNDIGLRCTGIRAKCP